MERRIENGIEWSLAQPCGGSARAIRVELLLCRGARRSKLWISRSTSAVILVASVKRLSAVDDSHSDALNIWRRYVLSFSSQENMLAAASP